MTRRAAAGRAGAEAGITLRQNYNRLAPRLAMQAGRYAHARQFKRMRKALKKLKGYTGRVLRDLRRQLDAIPEGPLRERDLDMLVLVGRLLHQGPKAKRQDLRAARAGGRLHLQRQGPQALRVRHQGQRGHDHREGFVVGMRALPGNPYDGHTLPEALEQVEILTGRPPRWPSSTAATAATA